MVTFPAFQLFYTIITGIQEPRGSLSRLLSFQKGNQDSKQLPGDSGEWRPGAWKHHLSLSSSCRVLPGQQMAV